MNTPRPQGVLLSSSALHALDEAGVGLSRVYAHWLGSGFALLTSWRSDSAPDENAANFAQLKRMFAARGFSWVPLWGRWRELDTGEIGREPSLLVPAVKRDRTAAPDELHDLALALGHTYDQQAVLVVSPGGEARLYQTNVSPPHLLNTFSTLSSVRLGSVFSELARKAGRAFAFESFEREPEPKGWAEAMARAAEGEIRE